MGLFGGGEGDKKLQSDTWKKPWPATYQATETGRGSSLKREEAAGRAITNKELTLLCFMIDKRHESFLSGLPSLL